MDDSEAASLEQMRALVEAKGEVRFHCQDRAELYEWVNRTLRQQDYGRLKRGGKGLVRRYIAKMTGLSRAQAALLIRCYQGGGEVKPRAYRRHRFASRYTRADIEVLAAVDEADETLSGPATQKILQRAWHEFHDAQCERLAGLSVAQLYRLRNSGTDRHRRVAYQPTRPTQVAIRHLPGALQMVDLYHARQHLWELSAKLFSADEGPANVGWPVASSDSTAARSRRW